MEFLERFLKSGTPVEKFIRLRSLKRILILVMFTVAALVALMSISIGKYGVDFFQALGIIYNKIVTGGVNDVTERVVWNLHLPRGLMAVVVGAALAVAGAVMQSMLHNPLADPYTTGVSSGAYLGASLYIVLGVSIVPFASGSASTIVNAFLMSLVPAAVITVLSTVKRISSTTMILIGIGVMYLFSAFSQLLELIATPNQIQRLYSWQIGTLSEVTLSNVGVVAIALVVCFLLLYRYWMNLNALATSDNLALSLGSDPWRTRVICLVVISFLVAVCVSFTGTIGFVGLVAPQMVRVVMGSDNRYLMPASAAFGALFLVCCDCIGRMVGDTGVPVGVVTAVIGSPLFLYMLVKRAKKPTI